MPSKKSLRRRTVDEATMSEYIKGFDAGYAYVLAQIERHPHMTMAEILVMLKGEDDEEAF